MSSAHNVLDFDNIFFDLSSDLFAISNFESYFVKLNKRWEDVLGYTLQELRSKPFEAFLHPDDLSRTKEEAKSLYETKSQTLKFSNRYISKSGKVVWLQWNATVDYERRLLYSVARDITEEIENEQEKEVMRKQLAESEVKYRSMLERTSDVVVLWGKDMTAEYISPSIKNNFGFTPDQFENMGPYDRIPEEDHHIVKSTMDSILNGANETIAEHRFIKQDGTVIWINSRIKAFRDSEGNLESLLTSSNEVTQRVEATLKLVEREERLQAITNNIPGAVFLYRINADGTDQVDYVSEGAEDIYGLSVAEMEKM